VGAPDHIEAKTGVTRFSLDPGVQPEMNENNFTRPLCPYPTYARYDGTGDINTAESFSCVQD